MFIKSQSSTLNCNLENQFMISIRAFILGVVITITLANQFRFGYYTFNLDHP